MIDFNDSQNDFGFTTTNISSLQKTEVDQYRDRLQKMYAIITPLIKNLMKNGDTNPIINWPNRTERLQKFLDELDDLMK
jgi:hypothetical protein